MMSTAVKPQVALNPNYYYDETTEWAVNTAGRITGEYEESGMSFVPTGGKGGS
jgi:hypothetical protein